MRCTADRGGETAGIIAGGDRPGVAGGVEFGNDANVGGLQPERVGNDLREHRAVALALRRRGDMHRHATERIERNGRSRLRAVLRPSLAALLRRQHGGDVAHIRYAWLDRGGAADAVDAALRARLRLPLAQFGEAAVGERCVERLCIVAGIEQWHRLRCGRETRRTGSGSCGSHRADRGRARSRRAASAVRARNRPAGRRSRG